ncbi:hypothetical protein DCAR_0623459 [Daucus carota subsp. sativus]|uniref:Replication protein A 70 kDa DNA-binding subunit B/D first OB fold domain-containing protein n=1 Tax=Daucus carota subsp. sativus TaxID=79200 RepID=A0AAF1B2E3_DAUCS|nr:hypothetical protein DCAR_0623459 [Daucus carota subsp. sativus]
MDSLLTLEPNARQDWKVRVRVSRKWRHIRLNGHTAGVNMIFVDEYDKRIHAWMNSSIMLRLEPTMVEGDVFDIENFIVRRYRAHERNQCFHDDKRIFLTNSTVVTRCNGPYQFIPRHVFDCVPLSTVGHHATQDTYLIDVCGIVMEVEPIQHFSNNIGEEQFFVRFVLADNNNNTIKAIMWNELALSVHMTMALTSQRPLIAIISSCKALIWQGGIPIVANMQATRIFMNSSHPEAVTLRVVPIMDHPYHRLKDLEVDMNNSGKIRVRVSRIWNHCLPNGTVAGINLILVDEFNGRMHAWLNSAFFKRLREILVEGKTIELQNFVVRKYRHGVTNQYVIGIIELVHPLHEVRDAYDQTQWFTNFTIADDRFIFNYIGLCTMISTAATRYFISSDYPGASSMLSGACN